MIPKSFERNFEHALQEILDQESSLLSIDKGEVLLDQGAFITHIPIVIDGRLKVSQTDMEGNFFYQP